MLEDFTMEKKPSSRSVQTPIKGCGTEVKKAQDTNSNVAKQFPRRSRRRETPGSKLDQHRKAAPQYKTTYENKRPKPKGQLYNVSNTQVVDQLTEQLDFVETNGRKKQNLNHLLKFHYAPRGEQMMNYHYRGDSGRGYNTVKWLMSTHRHKYNKEQFLQANCQFVVRSDGDYTRYMADPDTLVDWDMIEQVRVLSCEAVNCPICLDTPVAGKITRCGHVFCWPCMLHYLALSDKSWRKCPICYESVHRQDLKSVLVLLRKTFAVGEEITFQLMKREKSSLVASPVPQYKARAAHKLLSISEEKLDVIYSKLLTANSNQVLTIISREMVELELHLSENKSAPEVCFIEEAIRLLNERKNSLSSQFIEKNKKNSPAKCTKSQCSTNCIAYDNHVSDQHLNAEETALPLMHNDDDFLPTSGAIEDRHSNFQSFNQCNTVSSEEVDDADVVYDMVKGACELPERCLLLSDSDIPRADICDLPQDNITAEDLEIDTMPYGSEPMNCVYFYQAVDGQQLFLHAVNVRMLAMSYGSLEHSPLLITGTILEKESGSMTEELRRRLRNLKHLPVTCQFELAEVDLKPPIISDDTLDFYKEQLETRKKRRDKKARDERRLEKKMFEETLRQYGRSPAPRLRIDSLHHFPECGSDLASSPPSNTITGNNYTVESDVYGGYDSTILVQTRPRTSSPARRASSPDSISGTSPTQSSTGPSFAQMLSEGKTAGKGRMKVHRSDENRMTARLVNHDTDDESDQRAAPHRQSVNDAIVLALEKATLQHNKDEPDLNKGKKKKRKQKVIFSTGLACNSSK